MQVIDSRDILRSYVRTKTLTLRVPKWVNDLLDYIAMELGIPKSELLREAALEALKEVESRVESVSAKPDTEGVRQSKIIYV